MVARKRWGSCEPALEPDFQTLSIKPATAVTVHRARAWRVVCENVCVFTVRETLDKSQCVCVCVCVCVCAVCFGLCADVKGKTAS